MFIHIAELSKSMLSAGISLLHVLPDTYTVVVHRFFRSPGRKKEQAGEFEAMLEQAFITS